MIIPERIFGLYHRADPVRDTRVGLKERDTAWLKQRKHSARGFLVLPSRQEAIVAAIAAAGSEDIVLIAGKGHEKYQIGPDGRRFFDDCLEAQEPLSLGIV